MSKRKPMSPEAAQAFLDAMRRAQEKMVRVATDSDNPQTRSKYASYAALDRMVRPIYTGEGLALTFNTEPTSATDIVRVVCLVTRRDFTRRYQIDMPADGKGAKGGDVMTRTHATGAATTYGRRYLLLMIFNMAIGVDDDGNSADGKPPISKEELETINKLMVETGSDFAKFCSHAVGVYSWSGSVGCFTPSLGTIAPSL